MDARTGPDLDRDRACFPVHEQAVFIFRAARVEEGVIENHPHGRFGRFIGEHFLDPQRPLRRRLRIAPNDFQHAGPPSSSGLATGLPHCRRAGSPACALRHRLCFLACAKRVHQIASASIVLPYWTRHAERRSASACHMFVKGLSAARDKERLPAPHATSRFSSVYNRLLA